MAVSSPDDEASVLTTAKAAANWQALYKKVFRVAPNG